MKQREKDGGEIKGGRTHSHQGDLQMNRKAACIHLACACVCVQSVYSNVVRVYVICINSGDNEILSIQMQIGAVARCVDQKQSLQMEHNADVSQ